MLELSDLGHNNSFAAKTWPPKWKACGMTSLSNRSNWIYHGDAMIWTRFPLYYPSVRGIPRSLVNSPHKWPVMRNFDASAVVSLYKLWRSVIDVTKSRSSHVKDVRWNVVLQTMWQYVFSCEKSSRFSALSWRKYILVRLTTLYKNMSWKHNPTGMW